MWLQWPWFDSGGHFKHAICPLSPLIDYHTEARMAWKETKMKQSSWVIFYSIFLDSACVHKKAYVHRQNKNAIKPPFPDIHCSSTLPEFPVTLLLTIKQKGQNGIKKEGTVKSYFSLYHIWFYPWNRREYICTIKPFSWYL